MSEKGSSLSHEEKQILLKTSRFYVTRVERELPSGLTKRREIIRHPGSVVVIPLLDDGRICLIRNYRLSVDRWMIEFPAGTLEPGESPASCAARELLEETGYRARSLQRLCEFFPAPGILDECMHLFLARDLEEQAPQRQPEEEIVNLIVSHEQAEEFLHSGEICDGKTMIGLLWLKQLDRRQTR